MEEPLIWEDPEGIRLIEGYTKRMDGLPVEEYDEVYARILREITEESDGRLREKKRLALSYTRITTSPDEESLMAEYLKEDMGNLVEIMQLGGHLPEGEIDYGENPAR